MAKLIKAEPSETGADYIFWCPACKMSHGVWTQKKNYNNAIWSFNQNFDAPSFHPSLNITWGEYPNAPRRCHLVITNGTIDYQGDCTHELKGQKIPLPDFPEEE